MRTAFVALALVLAMPIAAEAMSFRGKTSQGRMASLVVGDDGFVSRIRISYSAPCENPRYRFANVLRVEPPFDESTPEAVMQKVTLRDRRPDGERSRQTAKITAERTVDDNGVESWSGTFSTRAVLTKRGRRIDVCQVKRVTWTAASVSRS